MMDHQLTQTTGGTRSRNCKSCGKGFSYSVGPGRDRIYCSSDCRENWKIANKKPRSMWNKCSCGTTARSPSASRCNRCYTIDRKQHAGVCIVQKCNDKISRVGAQLCEKHYYRKRRTGTTDDREVIGWYIDGHGYVHKWLPSHPLSKKSGYVSEHRMVVYDSLNGESNPCHWCGCYVDWSVLHVDHVDENKENNRISNLVISCPSCNKARGAMLHLLRRVKPESKKQILISVFDALGCDAQGNPLNSQEHWQ